MITHTNLSRTPRARRTGVSAAVVLAALTVTGTAACSTDPSSTSTTTTATARTTNASTSSSLGAPMTAANAVPSGRAGVPRGGLVTVANAGDVDQVADAIAATLFRYDTAIDNAPQDAARRAARWMTPALAAQQNTTVAGGGAWWLRLAAGHGWTTTALTRDTEPPATLGPGTVGRRVFVTVTAHTTAGAPAPAVHRYAVAMVLTRTGGGWRADQVEIRPQDGAGS